MDGGVGIWDIWVCEGYPMHVSTCMHAHTYACIHMIISIANVCPMGKSLGKSYDVICAYMHAHARACIRHPTHPLPPTPTSTYPIHPILGTP